MNAIELHNIVQRFGRSFVLRGIQLELAVGETLVLYGANGSGKTTLLKIIATALSPSRGTGRILGFGLGQKPEIRARSLIVSHALGFYGELSGGENLIFSANMHRLTPDAAQLAALLAQVGLQDKSIRLRPVRSYSSGMRKRLALARMLLLRPQLVLLDEPFAALDPAGKDLVEQLVEAEQARGTTILLTSHEPERAGRLASRELTLVDGLLAG
jgi:heme exporter protein A